MSFLYHYMTGEARGRVIFPLEDLRTFVPELFTIHNEKYLTRETHPSKESIPPLQCRWSDVLCLTAVPPDALKAALESCDIHTTLPERYLKFNPKNFSAARTTVWRGYGSATEARNFEQYDPTRLNKYAKISDYTYAYYRDRKRKGRPALVFYGIPHILYRGRLAIP